MAGIGQIKVIKGSFNARRPWCLSWRFWERWAGYAILCRDQAKRKDKNDGFIEDLLSGEICRLGGALQDDLYEKHRSRPLQARHVSISKLIHEPYFCVKLSLPYYVCTAVSVVMWLHILFCSFCILLSSSLHFLLPFHAHSFLLLRKITCYYKLFIFLLFFSFVNFRPFAGNFFKSFSVIKTIYEFQIIFWRL